MQEDLRMAARREVARARITLTGGQLAREELGVEEVVSGLQAAIGPSCRRCAHLAAL